MYAARRFSCPSFFHPSTKRRMYKLLSNGLIGAPCGVPRPSSRLRVLRCLVLLLINTITYYLPFLSPPCYARFGRALICHEKARTGSSFPNKSERSWNDAPINIRYHILLWHGPR